MHRRSGSVVGQPGQAAWIPFPGRYWSRRSAPDGRAGGVPGQHVGRVGRVPRPLVEDDARDYGPRSGGCMTRVAEGIYGRRLASGRRVFDIVYDLPRRSPGRRNQKWERGFRSLSKAKIRRAAVLTDLRRGTYVEPTGVTLGEFMMSRFEARHDVGAIRDTTHDGYKRHLENHVVPALGGMRLQDLTTADLNAVWAELARSGRIDGKGGLGSRTIRILNHLISQTLVDAQVQGLVVKNVAVGVTLPASTRPHLHFWSAEEVRIFLEGVRIDRDFALYYLDLTTGMRRGELLGLKWARTHIDIGELEIVRCI